MTGEEYLHLTDGDLCKLTEDIDTKGLIWHKGDIIEVVFRNTYKETIYVKNPSVTFNNRPSYKELDALFFFRAMELYKKWNEVKKNTFVTRFEHRFMCGDEVWFMKDNKPFKDIINQVTLRITRSKGIEWHYSAVMTGYIGDDTTEIYATKEELIHSLL